MPDIEVDIDLAGPTHPVGLLRRHSARGGETVTFEYAAAWLANTLVAAPPTPRRGHLP